MNDFFEEGKTYVRNDDPYKSPELTNQFMCEKVTRYPGTGELFAFGFMRPGEGALWGGTGMDRKWWEKGWREKDPDPEEEIAEAEICGSDGSTYTKGDCWCTRKPHTGLIHYCEPCNFAWAEDNTPFW